MLLAITALLPPTCSGSRVSHILRIPHHMTIGKSPSLPPPCRAVPPDPQGLPPPLDAAGHHRLLDHPVVLPLKEVILRLIPALLIWSMAVVLWHRVSMMMVNLGIASRGLCTVLQSSALVVLTHIWKSGLR